MTTPTQRPERARLRARAQLALFSLALVAVALVVGLGGLGLDRAHIVGELRSLGPLGPVAFVLVAGVLGALFVPAPFFSIVSSVVFGPVAGIPLGILAAVLGALIGREIGVRAARGPVEELGGPRLQRVSGWLERHGIRAVVALRLAPSLPDALVNYASGVTRLHRSQVAAGTAIGAIPRELGWGLVGAAIGGGSVWLATGGGALVIATDVVAVLAVIVLARRVGFSPRTALAQLRGR